MGGEQRMKGKKRKKRKKGGEVCHGARFSLLTKGRQVHDGRLVVLIGLVHYLNYSLHDVYALADILVYLYMTYNLENLSSTFRQRGTRASP